MNTSISKFHKYGFLTIDYPDDLRKAVERATLSWKGFCDLSKEQKTAFKFFTDQYGDGAGYELKEEIGSKKDLKENFHVTLFQSPRLTAIANQQSLPFLNDAKTLLDKIEPLVLQVAQNIQEEYKVHGLLDDVQNSKPFWILRYLHYFGGQQVGSEIAAPHADKGGFTLHLFESDIGLQYYCIKQRSWKVMPVNEKQTVSFSGLQLQLSSNNDLKALYHRVVATEKTALHGRFSMVCFIPFQNVPMYNKEKFGNVQTHDTGFNYTLPHHEFSNLFS